MHTERLPYRHMPHTFLAQTCSPPPLKRYPHPYEPTQPLLLVCTDVDGEDEIPGGMLFEVNGVVGVRAQWSTVCVVTPGEHACMHACAITEFKFWTCAEYYTSTLAPPSHPTALTTIDYKTPRFGTPIPPHSCCATRL